MTIQEAAQKRGYHFGHMTIGECIRLAEELGERVGDVILREAEESLGQTRAQVYEQMKAAFAHNMNAAQIGATTGSSFLLGSVGQDLNGRVPDARVIDDAFINRIVTYTLAAQVGNHSIGLRPCAGTGDSCPYTGFMKAVEEYYADEDDLYARLMAVILKIGGMYRVGKCTTGCNMEGIGAGACATAAAFVELAGGTPEQMEKAMVLAISPTISVPCTPRVLVPGLCATHIGGGILIARLASQLAMQTTIPSTVPIDVMIAMASQCHLASAEHVVPVTIRYMEPFFKRDSRVDEYVSDEVREAEKKRKEEIIDLAIEQSRTLADRANPIVVPFGDAVVGGSSEGVGSPTNCGRIAHYLSRGEIRHIKIELCPELFARRAINVPGILMAAAYGSGTDNAKAYKSAMEDVRASGIEVEIVEVKEAHVQRVTITASEQSAMVDSLNRGGARLVLREALPSRERALELARELNIVVIDH